MNLRYSITHPDPWLPAPKRLRLEDDEAHVWRIYLNQEPRAVQALRRTLAPDERHRAEQFHFRKDREHFIVCRGALREILSRYTKASPDGIKFAYGRYGKPALSGEVDDGFLRFNVSHSHGVALCAITKGHEVGVDIEFMQESLADLEIAKRFFSSREVSVLQSLPPEQRTIAFFNCWTRKEAYIKALGEGLSHPLHSFTVSLALGEPASLLSIENNPHESSRWSMVELAPGGGHVASLIVDGRVAALHLWQFKA